MLRKAFQFSRDALPLFAELELCAYSQPILRRDAEHSLDAERYLW